jgi:threonyl-tRNA synthetase
MYTTNIDERSFAVKPMNCPCHVQVFNHSLKSYRDLPIRFAEFGSCHRKEPSGTLHGLMRVRAFAQDDAHIFCTNNQIKQEAKDFNNLVFQVYDDFGFADVSLKLSTRPEKRIGSNEIWDKAEQALTEVLNNTGRQWELQPGEGAFYGPKIEYAFKDCIGRVWQLGTLQLDFSTPERLGAQYIAEDGSKQIPVMLHRAIFGSLERFMGILIEHYAGKLPVWLAVFVKLVNKNVEFRRVFAQSPNTYII